MNDFSSSRHRHSNVSPPSVERRAGAGSRSHWGLLPALAGALIFAAVSEVAAEEVARGIVFHDVNESGAFDAGDQPIPGVGVSNGREIAVTDDAGRYELPVEAGTVIFVVKPSGWRTAVNKDQIPQFFYVHSPEGATGTKFEGMPATGPLPLSIDFPLYQEDDLESFDVLVFGDTQPRNLDEVYYLSHDSLPELTGVDAAFGVTLGDIVFDNLAITEDLNSAVATIGIPWRHVIGNHDFDYSGESDAAVRGSYHRVYGPDYYAFAHGPAHFFALDNVRWLGKGADAKYRTGLGADQLAFVRNELRRIPKDRLIVFMAHIPWIGSTPWLDEGERDEFFALLAEYPNAISLVSHAHMHYHQFLGKKHGWPAGVRHHMVVVGATCGSWWAGAKDEYGVPHSLMRCGTPTGYGFLSVDGSDWKFSYRAARRPADFQMHIHAPNSVPATAVETEIFANVFNALPDADVRMRLGSDGGWVPMKRVVQEDPVYLAARAREAKLPEHPGRPMGAPPPSRHLWRAELPAGLAPGFQVIEVRAEDKWAVYEGRRLIRIE